MKKKITAFAVSMVMALSNVAFAADNLFGKSDFTSGLDGFQNTSISSVVDDDETHGKVLCIKSDPKKVEGPLFSGKDFKTNFNKALVSFEFNIKDSNSLFHIWLQSKKDGKDNLISRISLNIGGNLSITNDKVTSDSVSIDEGKWYNMDVVLDFETLKMTYFLDGEKIFYDNMCSKTELGSCFSYVYAGVTQQGKSGEMLVDNIYVRNYGLEDSFGVDESKSVIDKKNVKLSLDERIDDTTIGELDGIEVKNTVTGEAIDVMTVKVGGYNIELELDEEPDNNVEYGIFGLGDIKSITGKSLNSDILYFTKSGENGLMPEIGNSFGQLDFEDGAESSENVTFNAYNNAVYEIKEEDENTALCYAASGNEDGSPTYITFTFDGDDAEEKTLLVAYDVKLQQEDVLTFRTKITDTENSMIYNALFNAKNKFMSFNYPNLSPDYTTSMISESTTYASTTGISKDKWHKIVLQFDRDSITESDHGTTTIYMDNVQVGQFPTAASSFNGTVGTLRFEDFGQRTRKSNGQTIKWGSEPGASMLIDNIKIGYPKNNNGVKSIRLFDKDGKVYGPLTENISAMATGAVIYFNTDIDVDSVDWDTLKITSGSDTIDWSTERYDSTNKALYITFEELLDKSEIYNVNISGIKTSDNNNMADYGTTFSTSSKSEFIFDELSFKDALGNKINDISEVTGGEEINLCCNFFNSTDEDKVINLLLTDKKDYALQNHKLLKLTIAAGEKFSVTPDMIKLSDTDYSDAEICGYVCDENFNCMEYINLGSLTEYVKDDYSVETKNEITPDTTIVMLKGSATLQTASQEDIFWIDFVETEASEAKFKMNSGAKSGEYTIYFVTEDKTDSKNIKYVNLAYAKSLVDQIKTAAKSNDDDTMEDLILKNKEDFKLSMSFVDEIDSEKAVKMLADYINKNDSFGDNTEKDVLNVCKSFIIEGVAEKKVDNLFDYADIIGLTDSRLKDLYKKSFVTEAFQENVTSAVAVKSFSTYTEFEKKLYEAFVLQTFKTSDGIDNCISVIKEFYREIGLASDTVSNTAIKNAMNKRFGSYQELCAVLSVKETQTPRPSSSGGGGGGGSFSIKNESNTVSPTQAPIPQNIYSDLDGVEWAIDAIVKLSERGIINGKDNNEFKPNDNITREEFVKLVVKAFAEESESAEVAFKDMNRDAWYYEFIIKAVSAGLIQGKSDDYFGVGENITRQDMAVIVKRCADYSGMVLENDAKPEGYSDYDEIAEYAKSAMTALAANGIINGIDGRFAPSENATRAQAAVMIYNLLMKK